MKELAVEGCSLELDHGSGSVSISTTPSTVVKADGKGCYKGSISFSISGFKGTKILNPDGAGSGSISGSAQYTKIEGSSAVLKDDSVTVTLTGTAGQGSSQHPETEDVTVKVSDAGQTYAKGE